MKGRTIYQLKRCWSALPSSFWFVPTLIVAGSITLAVALVEAHSTGTAQWLARWPRLFGASAEGARGMLSTIAGSMMTVVGVTFSMTLVALALASSQYTSRILRNFMRDRVTQVVLGIFTGIFAYCLIVLRTIRSGDEGGFVPSLAVFFAVVLAMGGIGVLIFFIHHIAAAIQASSIIASVADETIVAVDRLFPEKLGQGPPDGDEAQALLPLPKRHWQTVLAKSFGIRQIVDMALRALSPSVNDTTTAVMCVDYLTAILARLASRGIPSSHRYEEGKLRIIAIGPTFANPVAESFDQIRGSATGNLGIMLRMLGALQTIASLTTSPSRRQALREQAQWIAELAERTIESPHDRARFESRLTRVSEALETKPVLFAAAKAENRPHLKPAASKSCSK
jgi:uncharacterized membrane protein